MNNEPQLASGADLSLVTSLCLWCFVCYTYGALYATWSGRARTCAIQCPAIKVMIRQCAFSSQLIRGDFLSKLMDMLTFCVSNPYKLIKLAHKTVLKLHAHSALYAHKLTTTRRCHAERLLHPN